ncbi:MAG: YihA family ribosome biogenesis GTP-binding protein [Cytophagales bacterium]|nr:MAG: YihA family ribosome biogenesis GTP-binding protein [Cytophagales bacterium]
MIIKTAKFLISVTDYKKCPKSTLPEYAFIGRSNVGKSSLINMLTNHSHLAKTSGKPGKTQTINHFFINENWYLVDLPGYGYAKASKTKQVELGGIIEEYITFRENLCCVFVLIDIRHEALYNDLQFMEWLGENDIPFVIVFTKADKLNPTQIAASVEKYKTVMMETWEEMPTYFVTSAETKQGKEDVLNFIGKTNSGIKK